eukprot:scaffold203626_cov30-Tisochrysis_lutea.AAC.2
MRDCGRRRVDIWLEWSWLLSLELAPELLALLLLPAIAVGEPLVHGTVVGIAIERQKRLGGWVDLWSKPAGGGRAG